MKLESDQILQIAKLVSDLFGLMTTLNVSVLGAIVLIVEKIFTVKKIFNDKKNRSPKVLFGVSLLFLIFSLLFSLFALASIPNNTKAMLGDKINYWVDPISFYGSIWSFFLGVLLFLILSILVLSDSIKNQKEVPPEDENTNRKKTRKDNVP